MTKSKIRGWASEITLEPNSDVESSEKTKKNTLTKIAILLSFFFIAVLITWPLFFRPDNIYLPVSGTAGWSRTTIPELSDAPIHMKAVEMASNRLRKGKSPLDVRPAYALPQSYVVSGAVLTTVLSISIIAFHNLFFVFSMSLAGYFQYLFIDKVMEDRGTAFLAGVLYMSSYWVFHTYLWGHTNQWQIQWIPLILFGVEKIRSSASFRYTGLLGVALALQVLSSVQYSVYLTFLLPLYVLLRFWNDFRVRFRMDRVRTVFADGLLSVKDRQNSIRLFLVKFGVAVLLAVILTSPYLFARYSMVEATPTRSLSTNSNINWVINDIFEVFWSRGLPFHYTFRLTLLAFGISFLFSARHRRQVQLAPLLLLFFTGTALGLGPFNQWSPYTILYQYWPLIDYFRVPQRVFPFIALGSSTLSASFLLSDSVTKSKRRKLLIIVLIVALQVVLVQEELGFQMISRSSGCYSWFCENTAGLINISQTIEWITGQYL